MLCNLQRAGFIMGSKVSNFTFVVVISQLRPCDVVPEICVFLESSYAQICMWKVQH